MSLLLQIGLTLSQAVPAVRSIEPQATDGFARRICGIPGVNGDGTDDLVLADSGVQRRGALWTISGKDGARINSALGEEGSWLGGSFYVAEDEDHDGVKEVHALVHGPEEGAVRILSGKTLETLRSVSLPAVAAGSCAWIEPAGDLDRDGISDAALCVVSGPRISFVELVSGKTGAALQHIDVPLAPFNQAGAVSLLPDLNGDAFPEIAIGTGTCSDEKQSFQVMVFSGRNGKLLWQPEGKAGRWGFGCSLGSFPDVDDDGISELLLVDDSAGRVGLFSGKDGKHLRDLPDHWGLAPGNAEMGGVATIGDCDGDGAPDCVVAVDALLQERAIVFSSKGGDRIRRHEGQDYGPAVEGRFGCSVAALGDLDHDGRLDYAVGASHSVCGSARGCVFVFSARTGARLLSIREADLEPK